MILSSRHNAIIEFLLREGYASVARLSAEFSVSEMTIRRDLVELEEQGLVQRTYGGAKPSETRLSELSWRVKIGQFVEEKKRIGQAAAELVNDDDTIIIDTGTTTFQILPHLAKKKIVAITNALTIAVELGNYPQIETYVAGGMLRNGPLSLVGPQTETFMQGLSASKLFVGVDGVHISAGYTVPNILDARTKQVMMKCAHQVIVVADHRKLGSRFLCTIANIDEAHLLITDSGAPEDIVAQLREHVEVLVV